MLELAVIFTVNVSWLLTFWWYSRLLCYPLLR